MPEFYEVSGTITKGKVVVDDPHGMVAALKKWADGNVIVRVERRQDRRSHAQNRFWHGIVIPAFADHCGYREDEMKEVLSLALIPKAVVGLDGVERVIPGRTSELSVKEFNVLIERAQQLGAEMGIYITDPGEYIKKGTGHAA